ncbi:hypothetical protein BGZ49_003450 [Haplosporangium sp. Z 27]|nr:hypothetical protein BGZ49_003450 [Haplosporangium sp. Z 27]
MRGLKSLSDDSARKVKAVANVLYFIVYNLNIAFRKYDQRDSNLHSFIYRTTATVIPCANFEIRVETQNPYGKLTLEDLLPNKELVGENKIDPYIESSDDEDVFEDPLVAKRKADDISEAPQTPKRRATKGNKSEIVEWDNPLSEHHRMLYNFIKGCLSKIEPLTKIEEKEVFAALSGIVNAKMHQVHKHFDGKLPKKIKTSCNQPDFNNPIYLQACRVLHTTALGGSRFFEHLLPEIKQGISLCNFSSPGFEVLESLKNIYLDSELDIEYLLEAITLCQADFVRSGQKGGMSKTEMAELKVKKQLYELIRHSQSLNFRKNLMLLRTMCSRHKTSPRYEKTI